MLSKVVQAYRLGGMGEIHWRIRRHLGFIRKLQFRYNLGKRITSVYGVKLASNFGDVTFGMYVQGKYGTYYWHHLRNIRQPFTYVDIGANQGLYTLCAAQNSASKACHAFEPNKKTHSFLEENIRINNLGGKCTAHNLAISDTAGEANLKLNEGHSGGASLAREDDDFGDTSVEIQTINHAELDELLGDPDTPLVVKVDVEGFEATVLTELMKSKHADKIIEVFYEVNEKWVAPEDLKSILEQAGFDQFEIEGKGEYYDVLASRSRA